MNDVQWHNFHSYTQLEMWISKIEIEKKQTTTFFWLDVHIDFTHGFIMKSVTIYQFLRNIEEWSDYWLVVKNWIQRMKSNQK